MRRDGNVFFFNFINKIKLGNLVMISELKVKFNSNKKFKKTTVFLPLVSHAVEPVIV